MSLMQTPGNWQSGQPYGAYDWSSSDYWNRMQPRPPLGAPPNASGGLLVEERVRTGSSGLSSVSVPPDSPMDVLLVDGFNPMTGRLNQHDVQTKSSKKLRKGIYMPTLKRSLRSLSLYYRDSARNGLNAKNQKVEDGENYRCAICLEDFEPRQEVMVTACCHVFHEECIVPWAKSSGRCPICRSAISE